MAVSSIHDARAEPNLTPILDMVFQLITFFMLVVNFKGAEADLSVELPVVGSAQPVDVEGQQGLLVLNIDAAGQVRLFGSTMDAQKYIASEAGVEVAKLQTKDKNFKLGDELPITVVVRADRALRFRAFHSIIKTCQEHGYRKFALKALNRPKES